MHKHLTDQELLTQTKIKADNIRLETLKLLELLDEVNTRKLFCVLGFGSLFKYIVDELKFSESQAAIYNSLIKAKILSIVSFEVQTGNLSLFAASQAAQVIREQDIKDKREKEKTIQKFKNLSKEKAKELVQEILNKVPDKTTEVITLSKELNNNIEKLKKKLNLPENMKTEDLLKLLVNDKLESGESIPESITITPKIKRQLLKRANYQCQFNSSGRSCQETKYLEVDHIKPKALGGSNHPENLRILCRAHNQRSAIEKMGPHINAKRVAF